MEFTGTKSYKCRYCGANLQVTRTDEHITELRELDVICPKCKRVIDTLHVRGNLDVEIVK
ncbi:MAG: hypothetical protein LBC38_01880 [Oscillospiraceae bacterium]|jgi:DNA-directed RNA polymerase subunit RPC12/RpoP|nr:hypothetical protein [Oscillospiraceae bacterium]